MTDELPRHARDEALIARALSGDRAAQRALAERLSPVIRARVARKLRGRGDPGEADEVAQKVWTLLFDKDGPLLGRWQPGGLSVENYVGRAAEWEALHHLRAQGRARTEPLDAADELPSPHDVERSVADRDQARKLYARVAEQLPPKGRLVLAALYADELSPDEAAELLGVTRQVVYNWQHRIRALARGGQREE